MFHKARIKLTLWYLLILTIISLAFSSVIYRTLINEVDRFADNQRIRVEKRLMIEGTPPWRMVVIDPDLIDEVKRRILITLIIINGSILVIAGGFSYLLAGRTLNPIAQMVEEQNRFISDASHELKTPLTSLKSAFEVYLRAKKHTVKEAGTIIKESILEVNKLQKLSESMLQLAQYQKPNGGLKIEKLSLSKIILEAIRKIEPISKKKEITVSTNLADINIEGYKYSLIDLLVILLDNAVKYSPTKSTINIKSEKINGGVLITVSDNGIGISQKDLSHIFDRFYRADSARLRSERGGYGLGLSIAKKITDLHNGEITAKSKLNKGSQFIIRLPTKQQTS